MKNTKLSVFVKLSMLVAVAYLLQTFLEFPLPMFPSFLKLDFSDLPAIIGAFAFGPMAGVIIELVKNTLHGITATNSAFIGELANFIMGSVFVFVSSVLYKFTRTKKIAVIGLILGTIATTAAGALLNYYLLLPAYAKFMGPNGLSAAQMKSIVMYSIIPFNIFKYTLVSLISLLVYKKVANFIRKEASANNTGAAKNQA